MKAAGTPPSDRRGIAILAILLIAIAALNGLAARTAEPHDDLERVRAEITRMRKQLQRVRRQARTAEQEIQSLDLQTAILSRELQVAVEETRALEAQKTEIQGEISSLIHRIERQKTYLSTRLAALYRLGSLSYLRLLLSLDQKKNPFEAAAMLSYLIHRDARAVTQFQETRQKLAEEDAALAEKQARIEESRRLVAQRSLELERSRRAQAALLARLRNESTESVNRIAELEEKARRLERLFQLLYERPEPGQIGAEITEFKGALEWPVHGEIVETFGPKRNARFATVTVSNGLKIEARPGTNVRAVFEGTVVFSQWFKGYGNLVIVDHGNRVFSLYGNTRGATVAAGDKIAPGQVVGQVAEGEDGGTGYLYFEVREDNKPVDPQTWLR